MSSYYMQHMLLQYGRQLTTARRLARHRQAMRPAGEPESEQSAKIRRRMLVERVTTEVVENLLLAGSDNPIVMVVLSRLNKAYGEKLSFQYPPGELDLRVFRQGPDGARDSEITGQERSKVMSLLWSVAEATVDETML
jgi:ABC-type uncharacterized transport system, permease and ATPase components